MDWNNKSILITGGTGSLGKALVSRLLSETTASRVVVFSRDELKQWEMSQSYPGESRLRFFLGDVRDQPRLERAFEGIDYVIHAAALKQVPAAEYNPFEFVKTNVLGAENIINAAFKSRVKRIVALSTDKACAPINLYGATKLCSDKLFTAANNVKGKQDISFSVVRYGNVMGSRGSVIPFFLERRSTGVLPITDERMTRFNILLSEGVDLVMHALDNSLGGEIFVPKIPSYRITDLAEAIGPDCEHQIVGIRPGEKIHELMVSAEDAGTTIETETRYIIVPPSPFLSVEQMTKRFMEFHQAQLVSDGFSYGSEKNTEWLSVSELRQLIHDHVDPSFPATA
ncbi:MAG: UDP-N-acetylglucosamine 4,6-dehydratase (inverting) [Planctomycetaceae bacterium]|nr:UDP-N-acetylglucosamine 4,6-dehydratase (inverting) [Planctomycetaceae bacterium]